MEYAVMVALIVIVVIGSVRLVGTAASSVFKSGAQALNQKSDGNQDGNGQI